MTNEPSAPNVLTGAGDLPADAFRMIVDMTANPFVVIAADGTIRYAGGSVESILGWRPEDLCGRNMADFLPPDQVALAIEAITEIERIDRDGAGVPMVFGVLRPDGGTTWMEIGAIPMLDTPGIEGIVLRHRVWDAQYHLDAFLDTLLADRPLDEVLACLSRSIAASLESQAATVHYGFDGTAFEGCTGFGVPEPCLDLSIGPWCTHTGSGATAHAVSDLAPPLADAARRAGLRSCWTVSVPTSDGLAPAVLTVWRSTDLPPLIGHRHVLNRSTRYVQLALVRSAEHQRLRHLAGHDALTGVANRHEFRDRLAHALSIGERDIAVAFCDLDGFKPVNDSYGHLAGDRVLVEVADRLRASLRTGDELARIGGDEFTVLLRNVPDTATALHVAERLLASVREPFSAGETDVALGLSVGVVMADAASSADSLLARADDALYAAKRAGGGTVRVVR